MQNLIEDPAHRANVIEGRQRLLKWLEKSGDPILVPAREALELDM